MLWLIIYVICVFSMAAGLYMIFSKNVRGLKAVNVGMFKNELRNTKIVSELNGKRALWKKQRENKIIDKEVYEAISFLRNIISIERGKQMGTDFIIEQLSEREGLLQNTYIKMLSFLRINKKNEAQKIMADRFETAIGKEFASLLIKWDEINPGELSEILMSHQKSIKEIRITQQRRRDEAVSDLLYFPVIINVVLIFINFIYVGYFINQKEILQMLF